MSEEPLASQTQRKKLNWKPKKEPNQKSQAGQIKSRSLGDVIYESPRSADHDIYSTYGTEYPAHDNNLMMRHDKKVFKH